MITLRHIEIFDKVATVGSMRGAAAELYISQSAISQSILEIERTYNITLFTRFKKRLILTPLGEEFLNYARQALLHFNDMNSWLNAHKNESIIRVGATGSVGAGILSQILISLKFTYPHFKTQTTISDTNTLCKKLIDGTLDVVITGGNVNSPELVIQFMTDDEMVLFCGKGHPFFRSSYITPFELKNHSLLLREEGSVSRTFITKILDSTKTNCQVAWTSHDNDALKDAAINGLGLGVLSSRLIKREVKSGLLKEVRLKNYPMIRQFNIIYHTDRIISEGMKLFMDEALKFTS